MALNQNSTQASLGPEAPLADLASLILRELPMAVLVFDLNLRVIHRNSTASNLFGQFETAADFASELAGGEGINLDPIADLNQVIENGLSLNRDGVVYSLGQNDERLLNLSYSPVDPGPEHRPSSVVLIVEDVTARVGLERRLAVSERMAAVGKLAAKIAHELNNPLDGILRYINLTTRVLKSEGYDNPKVLSYLSESGQGLMRMAEILSELLVFSRNNHTQFDEVDINKTVEESLQTLHQKADAAGVTIALVFRDQKMPALRGGMLYQICCNLIKNAIDAMPDGGRLTLTTGLVDDEVIIRFEDTGSGLPKPIDQVFEAFFTTKPAGKGTGLGLAICKDHAERLGGRITAEQGQPTGAVFTVRIPLARCIERNKKSK